MRKLAAVIVLGLSCAEAQKTEPAAKLRITSRSVLVDVIVTNSSGRPVTGLPRDAFDISEQGKPQSVTFFEEHGTAPPTPPVEMPKLPPDVFTNFSPFPQPPAVNVLLLDSLNTRMESQSVVHTQAMKFLKSAKPGTRSAIFTMGLTLHFIQGFNDDPAVLAAALNNKKNLEVEPAVMLKSLSETNALGALPELTSGNLVAFLHENDVERTVDRELRTLANLQRLAAFLQGFPGRKNIIWFAEKLPGGFVVENRDLISNPVVDGEVKKTLAMLGVARAALYPVDARGNTVNTQYVAENNPKVPSADGGAIRAEDKERNSDQIDEQIVAEQSGGRAFVNTNDLSGVIDKITSESSHFYTLSYVPTNLKIDGGWRKIDVKISVGKYRLSYRRGYFAVDTDRARAMVADQDQKTRIAPQNPPAVDPLLPFMDLGMPQSQQILYKVLIVPTAAAENEPADKKDKNHYKVDFAIDLGDLKLDANENAIHTGSLNVSLVVYDRYGNIINREDRLVQLNIKPDVYVLFQKTGVQLHADLAVPKGNFWLRTGIFDRGTGKVGTMEIPLAAVKPLETATK